MGELVEVEISAAQSSTSLRSMTTGAALVGETSGILSATNCPGSYGTPKMAMSLSSL
jgi:hypothetical protein